MHLTVLLSSLINQGYTQVYEIIFTQYPTNIGTLEKNGNKSCLNLARFQSVAKQVCALSYFSLLYLTVQRSIYYSTLQNTLALYIIFSTMKNILGEYTRVDQSRPE